MGSQSLFEKNIFGPEQGIEIERQGEVGGVIRVHAAAQAICFKPGADGNYGFANEDDGLGEPVEGIDQVLLGKPCRCENAVLVLEEFGEGVIEVGARVQAARWASQ